MTNFLALIGLLAAACSAPPPVIPSALHCAGPGFSEFVVVMTPDGMGYRDLGPESFRWLPKVYRASDEYTYVARDDDERDFLSVEIDANGSAIVIARDGPSEYRSDYFCQPIRED